MVAMSDEWPEQAEITDPTGIALLTDLRALRFLMPFLQEVHTLTSAARSLQRSTGAVAYWIPRLLAAGLIEHLGDEARAGRAMPRYRGVARQVVVPFEQVPFDRRVALLDGGRLRVLRRFLDGIDEVLTDSHGYGLGFSNSPDGGMAITMVEDPAASAARSYTDSWATLYLGPDDALALAQELEALVERYASRGGPRRHILHLGLAPDPRFRWRSAEDDLPS